jgi:hypothetical protein
MTDDITPRQYIDLKIMHEREIREEWRMMNDKMVQSAKEYVDAKLDKMNEMREQIEKERAQLLNRGEYLGEHKALETRVNGIEKIVSNLQGRLAVIGAIWSVVVIVIAHFWK